VAETSADRTWRILRIALRNFRRFRLQAALIVVAALTGTGGVIVSTGYAAGGREKILSQFSRLGTNTMIVTPQLSRSVGGRARTGSIVTTLNEADYKAILQGADWIKAASPTVSSVFRIRAGDLTKNTTVVGCESDYFRIRSWTVFVGEGFDSAADRRQARVVLLGATAARDLFGADDPTGQAVMIGRVPFSVAGVLAERGQGLDAANEDDQVYVPLETAMHRLMNVDYFKSIVFEIDAWQHMDDAEGRITALLQQRHQRVAPGVVDFQVQNQKRLIEIQLAAFGRFTFLIRWIAASALTVSSLGIFAVTWIGVGNRTREIGTRRAIGARQADILVQFIAEGMAGALIGSVAGVMAGYVALRQVDLRAGQPFQFSVRAVMADLVASTAIYAVFTLLSGLKAIRIQPSVALRAE
jgi:putative ABC transport system permease protein